MPLLEFLRVLVIGATPLTVIGSILESIYLRELISLKEVLFTVVPCALLIVAALVGWAMSSASDEELRNACWVHQDLEPEPSQPTPQPRTGRRLVANPRRTQRGAAYRQAQLRRAEAFRASR